MDFCDRKKGDWLLTWRWVIVTKKKAIDQSRCNQFTKKKLEITISILRQKNGQMASTFRFVVKIGCFCSVMVITFCGRKTGCSVWSKSWKSKICGRKMGCSVWSKINSRTVFLWQKNGQMASSIWHLWSTFCGRKTGNWFLLVKCGRKTGKWLVVYYMTFVAEKRAIGSC